MTREELIKKAKLRIRKTSSDILDDDVGQLVDVAFRDLKRFGVNKEYLDITNITDPLIIEAALTYTKANFGNPENSTELMQSYDMICTKIKGGGYHRGISNTLDQEK